MPIRFTIQGEPASKANSRRFAYCNGKPRLIKSLKALYYLQQALPQIPQLPDLLSGDVRVKIKIFYGSRRPDLDESLILDAMQGRIYKNDRQVKEKHIQWGGVDQHNPRAEIEIIELKE